MNQPLLPLALPGILALAVLPGPLTTQPMTLEYKARYTCQRGEPDHLMATIGLSGDRALVGGNRGVALVNLKTLPPQGTRSYLYRLLGVDARDFCLTPDEKYVYVNTHRGNNADCFDFTVLKITGNTLSKVTTRREAGVLYEKMCLQGDYLYVAAHAFGLRIYNVRNRENPILAGKLQKGLTDAFAVAVDGNTAYVADGGGGLKIVDVTNKAAPVLKGGETLATARGTSEDVTVRNGRVYVAAGGAGLAVYEAGKLNTRTLYPTPGAAESLAWIGSHLAVGHLSGVRLYAIGSGTAVTLVASETAHRRGASATLRITNDVGAATANRLLVADWNTLDVYEVKLASGGTQPDINASVQRLRFPPSGGTRRVTVTNNGQATLTITSVSVTSPAFGVNYAGGSLKPGASASFDITYKGGSVYQGSGVVQIASNDPDENPLPIQVFGNTGYLDPGEAAVDFTLPTLKRDPRTGQIVSGPSFTLSRQRGKVVWFSIFATW